MAWTHAQLDELENKIALASKRTRDEHGREIENPDLKDLLDLREVMMNELGTGSTTARLSRAAFHRV